MSLNKTFKIIKFDGEPYCEWFRCPRIRKKGAKKGMCDGKCPKPHGKENARIGRKRARLQMKRLLENEEI